MISSKNKKNPDRCLPRAKANSMTKSERAATARKKKKAGAKGKTVVPNTKKGKVTKGYTKENIKNLENIISKSNLSNPKINFVGMMTNEWGLVSQYSKKNNIIFNANGGTFNLESDKNKTIEENMKLIQESIIAPSVQTEWQVNNLYIPCRIFKNISYGKMGLTNNPAVNELFNTRSGPL